MVIGKHISIITLNVIELNAPTKRHRLAGWIQKQDTYNAAYQRLTTDLKTHILKVRGWKKIFHANGNENKPRVALLISDRIDFKTKSVTRDKKRYYIRIKG